ncbi:MAG: hypothetical protein KA173_10185 [Rhodoferax sp.]|nr:hypothetical protein [Rhodoferax sp.]
MGFSQIASAGFDDTEFDQRLWVLGIGPKQLPPELSGEVIPILLLPLPRLINQLASDQIVSRPRRMGHPNQQER